jgi:AraC-like DNA-binding protein
MKPPARPQPSADFASAAMVRVLAQGMRELGLNPTAAMPRAADQRATVSLDEKRLLVRSAIEQGGWGCLALLGRGLHRYAQEPTHIALASARDARDLFNRWARLEHYIHSRHRIEVLSLTEGSAHIVHRARAGLPPPLLAEGLVVLGVLVAFLEAMRATKVAAWVGDIPVYPEPEPQALALLAQQDRLVEWRMAWAPASALHETPQMAAAPSPTLEPPQTWPAHAQHCFSTLSKDLMTPLNLPALAEARGEAPRSLQRNLSRAGLSYTHVLSEARCRAASWWLLKSPAPIAEVGFVSGYADQPHFTRDFRTRVGLTPLRFRTEFAATS